MTLTLESPPAGDGRPERVASESVVAALLRPAAYPHWAGRPRLVETHISWVFLAGRYVYKVKKPVDFGFLDYSTFERRRALCEREVALNQRLCPGTYLGVVPITEGRMGSRSAAVVPCASTPSECVASRPAACSTC